MKTELSTPAVIAFLLAGKWLLYFGMVWIARELTQTRGALKPVILWAGVRVVLGMCSGVVAPLLPFVGYWGILAAIRFVSGLLRQAFT